MPAHAFSFSGHECVRREKFANMHPTNISDGDDLQCHLRNIDIRQKNNCQIRIYISANVSQNRLHNILAISVFYANENVGFLECFGLQCAYFRILKVESMLYALKQPPIPLFLTGFSTCPS